jgi:hypothetical protein
MMFIIKKAFYIFATKCVLIRLKGIIRNNMARRYYKAFLLLFVIMFANSAFAQGPPPPPPPLPIDGGILALVAAGVVYAIKKIRDNK